jgi:hypothetical protein
VEHWVDGARYEGKCDESSSIEKATAFGRHSPAILGVGV